MTDPDPLREDEVSSQAFKAHTAAIAEKMRQCFTADPNSIPARRADRPINQDELLPPGFRPLGELFDELEADMIADAEREVEAVAEALADATCIPWRYTKENTDDMDIAPGRVEYRNYARAAITALDQVREGKA